MKARFLCAVAVGLCLARPCAAQESSGVTAPSTNDVPDSAHSGEKHDPFKIHGFVLGAVSGRTTGVQPVLGESGDFVLGEGRLRLNGTAQTASGKAGLVFKGDAAVDGVTKDVYADIREGYASYTAGPLEFRAGRQIITWGVGDLLFISDVFPKDWESFFAGRPPEYLKLGVDGARVDYSSQALNVDLVVLPFFTSDRLPSPERFLFFNPYAAIPEQHQEEPETNLGNTEVALRISRRVAGFDTSIYAYRGFWRDPSVRLDNPVNPTSATLFFPVLSVYGLSVQRNGLGGVVSMEAGYYDSRDDRSGANPAIPNSQSRALAGYQREAWKDFTVGFQGYAEVMRDYTAYRRSLPAGTPAQDHIRGVLTTRLTQYLHYQTWRLSLFAAYSPTDEDYFLQPAISYKVTEKFSVGFGASVFGGQRETTYFGQFDKSDNVWSNLRFDF
jgi:hypothetical protein